MFAARNVTVDYTWTSDMRHTYLNDIYIYIYVYTTYLQLYKHAHVYQTIQYCFFVFF